MTNPDAQLLQACADYRENRRQQAEVGPERSAVLALDMDNFDMWRFIEDAKPQTPEGAKARTEILARVDWRTSRRFRKSIRLSTRSRTGSANSYVRLASDGTKLSPEARDRLDAIGNRFRFLQRERAKERAEMAGLAKRLSRYWPAENGRANASMEDAEQDDDVPPPF